MRAARIGPTVWELEGPIPILNKSNILIMKWHFFKVTLSDDLIVYDYHTA
jgi:hypothetical protein